MPASPSTAGTPAGTAPNQGEEGAVQATIAAYLVRDPAWDVYVCERACAASGFGGGPKVGGSVASHRPHGTTFAEWDTGATPAAFSEGGLGGGPMLLVVTRSPTRPRAAALHARCLHRGLRPWSCVRRHEASKQALDFVWNRSGTARPE